MDSELLWSPLLLEEKSDSNNLTPGEERSNNEQEVDINVPTLENFSNEIVQSILAEEEMDHDPIHQIYNHEGSTTDALSTSYATTMKQRQVATTLYLLTTSLLFADQNLMSPNLSAIAEEFGFDDNTRDKKLGGDIAIAFFMVGVPASFLVGCLADVIHKRSLLFLWVILIGE